VQTLEAFLQEAGLSEDAGGITGPDDWTIEKILEEKKQYDASLAFEKKDNGRAEEGWSYPSPSTPVVPEAPINSNVLCVSGGLNSRGILITAADRSWNELSPSAPYSLISSIVNSHGSPILSLQPIQPGYVLSTSMSGQLMLHHVPSGRLLDRCRHHLKYAVQVSSEMGAEGWIVATAGWDQKIHIYAPDQARLSADDGPSSSSHANEEPSFAGLLGEPIHTINLPTVPESMVLVRHPDTKELALVFSRRDSTFLHYYLVIPDHSTPPSIVSRSKYVVQEGGKQNLAPHSNAWIAFTPACLAVCPTDPTLLAVATSHLPHMKLIMVRLLFPGAISDQDQGSTVPQTQASQARAELAVQDREDAAISLHVSTMAPQTPYSTPQVVWRPTGSGVFVNADDGAIRGIDTRTGKVVALLKGHEPGSKVRTLWAGKLDGGPGEDEQEILVSGGFDKRVFIWKATTA